MGKAERRKKDSEHAQYMKRMGITRKTGRCPINHTHIVANGGLVAHFATGCK